MRSLVVVVAALVLGGFRTVAGAEPTSDYAVVVSQATAADAGWATVVAALKEKHGASVVTFTNSLRESRPRLRELQPRYVAVVARPQEIDVDFVRRCHLVSRGLDDDPYADFIWGIVTGCTPEDALRLAKVTKPLVVKRALTTTGVNAGLLDTCLTLSDGRAGDFMLKTNGVTIRGKQTNDNLAAWDRFYRFYQSNDVDLLVSSSHSTEVNLEMPFGDGAVVLGGTELFMVDRPGLNKFVMAASRGAASGGLWFQSPEGPAMRAEWAKTTKAPKLRHATNPKIYIAAGNCLIGDVMRTEDSMVLAWLSHQGALQFVGYTVPTWYGRGGWGTLELFQEFAGQITLAEAFHLNHQRIVHALLKECPELMEVSLDAASMSLMAGERRGPATQPLIKMSSILQNVDEKRRKDLIGHLYDRDAVAFYGDPKWDARADGTKQTPRVEWKWSSQADRQTVTLQSAKGWKGDKLFLRLPQRAKDSRVVNNAGLDVMLNDEFLLVSKFDFESGKTYRIEIGPNPPEQAQEKAAAQ
jgi:zinc protease